MSAGSWVDEIQGFKSPSVVTVAEEGNELEHVEEKVEEKNGWIARCGRFGAPARKAFKSTTVFLLLLKTEN